MKKTAMSLMLSTCLLTAPAVWASWGKLRLHRHRNWYRQSILRTCLDRTGCVRGAERQVRHHGQRIQRNKVGNVEELARGG